MMAAERLAAKQRAMRERLTNDHRSEVQVPPSGPGCGLERNYSPDEIATAWGLSRDTVRRLFLREPGVLILAGTPKQFGKRPYRTIRVPQSVVTRVHQRMTHGEAA